MPDLPLGKFDITRCIQRVKAARRMLSSNGFDDFSSRYLTEEGRLACSHHTPTEILFNYAGNYNYTAGDGKWFASMPNDDWKPFMEKRTGTRSTDFEITSVVLADRLEFYFQYSASMKHQERIDSWIDSCQDALNCMAASLLTTPRRLSAIDSTLLKMDKDTFSTFFAGVMHQTGIHYFTLIQDVYPCSSMQEGVLVSQSPTPHLVS